MLNILIITYFQCTYMFLQFILIVILQSRILPFLCNAIYVILSFPTSFSLLCFLFQFFCSNLKIGCEERDREKYKRMRPKKELHELPQIQMVKSDNYTRLRDFTISEYGSSCSFIFFGLILPFFSLRISWHSLLPLEC